MSGIKYKVVPRHILGPKGGLGLGAIGGGLLGAGIGAGAGALMNEDVGGAAMLGGQIGAALGGAGGLGYGAYNQWKDLAGNNPKATPFNFIRGPALGSVLGGAIGAAPIAIGASMDNEKLMLLGILTGTIGAVGGSMLGDKLVLS